MADDLQSSVPSPFEGRTPPARLGHVDGVVTLVEGQTFCLSGRTGDMVPDLPHGLFVHDTRLVSQWELRIDGMHVEPLTIDLLDPFRASFVAHAHPRDGLADADVVVFRDRSIGLGMRERITVTNHALHEIEVLVELTCDADFADLFAVKEGRAHGLGRHPVEATPAGLLFTGIDRRMAKGMQVRASQASTHHDATTGAAVLTWRPSLAPRETWELCVDVEAILGGAVLEPRFSCGAPDAASEPDRRLESWRTGLPTVDTDALGLAETVRTAGADLGALRIFDPDRPDVPIVAAGAPWFMTVFGRDSLITGWMALLADPSLTHGVLETLARFQGTDVNPYTEEEPGKILHEMRFGSAGGMSLGGGDTYYGSVDATPLFVMLLGELHRWDLADAAVEALLPHADAALAWIEDFGDRDGDGYVEYERASRRGLVNQGWKDSWDAVRLADGELAEAPIALCEVQGYVYAAYVARAYFAREAGDEVTCQRWRAKAEVLRQRFNEDFWLEEHGWYAMGLDRDKRPIDALASNMGHCLWTGIVDRERAPLVAERLVSDELFSGWGVRTLATSMAAYNPVSYHNGSVWPHDNAICAAGLARYGFMEAAHRIIGAQLDVARAQGGRLPELFAGLDRGRPSTPAAYPTSCSPQAWAAASPLLWLRSILRLEPSAAQGEVWLQPELPPWMGHLQVDHVGIGGNDLTIRVEDGHLDVTGAGPLEIHRGTRPSMLDPLP